MQSRVCFCTTWTKSFIFPYNFKDHRGRGRSTSYVAHKAFLENICQSLYQIFEAFNKKVSFRTHANTLELCSESLFLGWEAERAGIMLSKSSWTWHHAVKCCGRGKTLQNVLQQQLNASVWTHITTTQNTLARTNPTDPYNIKGSTTPLCITKEENQTC